MKKIGIFAVYLSAFLLSGCFSEPGEKVTAAEYGDAWPFTVESGHVNCLPSGAAVFVANDRSYALTGLAQSRGYPVVDPIWLDNPRIPGTKISLGDITKAALALC